MKVCQVVMLLLHTARKDSLKLSDVRTHKLRLMRVDEILSVGK